MTTIHPAAAPPVVFISQIGTGGDSWQPTIDLLTTSPTTFTYDRPGTGSCPPRPAPNPALPFSAFADELAVLLDHHGIAESVVLVGHSIGSPIARMFADRYPQRTAGIVHVDGSVIRRSAWPVVVDAGPPMDGDGPGATEFDVTVGETEVVNAAIPAVPAAVVTRTPGNWHPSISAESARLADPFWTAHQRQSASQHGVPLVVATDAGHQIPAEAPALVAYVIDRVVDAVRRNGPVELDTTHLGIVGGVLDDVSATV